MKKITVAVDDESNAELVETVEVHHLSDVADGVKEVVEDFVKKNDGVVLPPMSIEVTEQKTPATAAPSINRDPTRVGITGGGAAGESGVTR